MTINIDGIASTVLGAGFVAVAGVVWKYVRDTDQLKFDVRALLKSIGSSDERDSLRGELSRMRDELDSMRDVLLEAGFTRRRGGFDRRQVSE